MSRKTIPALIMIVLLGLACGQLSEENDTINIRLRTIRDGSRLTMQGKVEDFKTDTTEFVYQLRKGDALYPEFPVYDEQKPLVRLLDYNDSTALFAVIPRLAYIEKDGLAGDEVVEITVGYEEVGLRTPTLDKKIDFYLRIDTLFEFATPPDTIPRLEKIE